MTPAAVLTCVLVAHVLCLSAVVLRFSSTNLRGRADRRRQLVGLGTVAAALLAMIAADDLTVFAAGWTLSGLVITALVAAGGTHRAPRAARRVLVRLVPGDLALWALVAADAGSLDLPAWLATPALLLAVASRGALVPLGDWLAETAEAPSPVSALLHAGVVNGGVLLLVLHGDRLPAGPGTAVALAVVAALTIVSSVLAQQGRADVKGRLAASTSAQMALATGVAAAGLPGAALLHVVGHAWWKAWSFLNAGGAVSRARTTVAIRTTGVRRALAAGAGLSAGVGVLTALATIGHGAGDAHPPLAVDAVPAVLVGLVVAATLAALLAVPRPRGTHLLAALGVLVGLAGLVSLAATLEDGVLPGAALPASAPAAAVLLIGIAVAAATPLRAVSERGPLALLRVRAGLPVGSAGTGGSGILGRRTRLAERLAAAAKAEQQHGEGGAERVRLALRIASSPVSPAWPLRSAIAVSPYDGLAHFEAETAAELLDRFHGRDPREPLARLVTLHREGTVTDIHVRRALRDLEADGRLPDAWRGLPPHDLLTHTLAVLATGASASPATDDEPHPRPVGAVARTLAGAQDLAAGRRPGEPGTLTDRAVAQAAAWCAQAWSRTASVDDDPWRAWLRAARRPGADLVLGVRGVRAAARELPEEPVQALALLHDEARRRAAAAGLDPLDLFAFLAGLLATAPGWAAHARWRVEHGDQPDALVALCALRAVHDLLLADLGDLADTSAVPAAPVATGAVTETEAAEQAEARRLLAVWQRALDLAVGERLLGVGARPAPVLEDPDDVVHSLWCLDARSAPLRRHLEAIAGSRRHRTHGVAGFFGVAVDAVDDDGTRTARAPGLLRPDLRLVAPQPTPAPVWTASAAGRDPLSALGYAELGGVLAVAEVLADVVRRVRHLPLSPKARQRRAAVNLGRVLARGEAGTPHEITPAEKASRVAAVLRAAGIADELGPVLLVVGHGATTANNAYAAAYDCGACGANPGILNATLLADWFNDPAVRAEMWHLGVAVPARSTAVPAWHDTTADVVIAASDHPDVRALQDDLDRAARRARAERALDLPGADPLLRGADIAEAMPEWGLAGAQGLLIGRGRIPDPGARWFQLEHRHEDDLDLSLLRDALAGPGLVAAGIMACYASSAVAPDLFGAGDKTIHNVVGDVGVLRGRTGDLAIGLPWQALGPIDPKAPGGVAAVRHLPARPVIAVEAHRDRVLAAVAQVPQLQTLVANRWVSLWAVEPAALGERPAVAEFAPGRGWVDLATGAPVGADAAGRVSG